MKGFKELFKDFENKCIDDFRYKRASLITNYNNKPSSEFYNVEPLFHNDDLSFYKKINNCLEYCLNENVKIFLKNIIENKGIEVRDEDIFLMIDDYAIFLRSSFGDSVRFRCLINKCLEFSNEKM